MCLFLNIQPGFLWIKQLGERKATHPINTVQGQNISIGLESVMKSFTLQYKYDISSAFVGRLTWLISRAD